jgi:hypothetical protein
MNQYNGFTIYHKVRKEYLDDYYRGIRPIVKRLLDKGLSLGKLAVALNSTELLTPNGKSWTQLNVASLLRKLELHTKYSPYAQASQEEV